VDVLRAAYLVLPWARRGPLLPTTHSQPSPSFSIPPFSQYSDERDLPFVMALVDAELSEPYSIFTYRSVKGKEATSDMQDPRPSVSIPTHALVFS